MTVNSLPLVYIITLNWNRRDDTLAFLDSNRCLTYPNFRIVVVDNGSTDGSAQTIAARFPDVALIQNDRNLGFAAGANMGIWYGLAREADFVFVANNDTLIAPGALDILVRVAVDFGAGLVAPAIYYAADPRRIWSVGAWRNPATLEIGGDRRGQVDAKLPDRPFRVDFITGCGMLISRRCLEEVGAFDERFFMYYEDLDYCLRVRSRGYPILVAPGAVLWHKVAVSSGGADSPAERYSMALASILFFRKHVRGARWLIVAPYRMGSAVKTLARLVAGGRTDSAQAYLRGLWQGLRAAA